MITTSDSNYAPTSVGVSPYLRILYIQALLARNIPNWVWRKDARTETVPMGKGGVLSFRRRNRFPVVNAANHTIREGITPTPMSSSMTQITVAPVQYGGWTAVTDLVSTISFDPIVAGNSEDLGIFSSEVQDLAMRDQMLNATSVIYAGGKTSRGALAAGDVITDNVLKQVVSTFKKKAVPTFPDGTYHGVYPSDSFYDLANTDAWKLPGYYQDKERIATGKVSPLYGITFMDSPIVIKYAGAGASGVDVYRAIFYAPGAFGAAKIDGLNTDLIVKPLGSGGTEDPLNQRGTQGTKWTDGTLILDQDRIVAVEFVPGFVAA